MTQGQQGNIRAIGGPHETLASIGEGAQENGLIKRIGAQTE